MSINQSNIESPPLTNIEKLKLRLSIKMAILGCVSAGKSTLVNTLLTAKLSDTKIKRTTMIPQVYLEGISKKTYANAVDSQLNIAEILEHNSKANQDILSGKEVLTKENCTNLYHEVPKLYDILNLPDDIHLDIYDIPGLNDSTTEDIYYDYIEKYFPDFDILCVVVDINESFNTSSSIKILDEIVVNSKKNMDKNVNICIIASFNKDNGKAGILAYC